jgi:hypothetical protein
VGQQVLLGGGIGLLVPPMTSALTGDIHGPAMAGYFRS